MSGSPPPPDPPAPEVPDPTGELDVKAVERAGVPSAGSAPAPGSLGIRERRSWRTWQLAVTALGMLIAGMALGNAFAAGSPSSSSGATGGNHALPPPAASSRSTSAPSAGSTPTTTAPTAATASNGASTTTAPVTGTESVLVGPYQSKGNWTSPSFTIAGGQWNIGWAFQCSPVPTSGASLEIFVVPDGGSPGTTPAVSENGASGQSVTSQTSTGSQQLIVQAPAGCIWAVKVTGIG